MYGGLFGDLPATKKEKSDDQSDGRSKSEVKVPLPVKNELVRGGGDSQAKPTRTTRKPEPASSFLFVPAAARNRKRSSQPNKKQRTAPIAKPFVLGGTDSDEKPTKDAHAEALQNNTIPSDIVKCPKNPEKESNKSYSFDATDGSIEIDSENDDEPTPVELKPQASADIVQIEAPDDPYDPLVPNDLLLYKEEKKRQREREILEKEQQAALQAQQDLARKMEEKRQDLVAAGDYGTIVSMESRGRGRGVSNLPAWLRNQTKHPK